MKKTITHLAIALCAGFFAVSCGNNAAAPAEERAETTAAEVETTANSDTMKYQSSPFLYESELAWQTPVAGLKRQIMGYNDELMQVKIDFEAGCDGGGQHAHAHSQTSVVVSGVFEVTIDGVTKTLKAGDGFYAAPNLVHGAVCIEAGTLIDAFSPMREDFLK
jgi:quercetin dioxygenase-like cupin family protein